MSVNMKILQLFGFFVIFWQNQFAILVSSEVSNDVVMRGCKNLENTTPLLRLRRYLSCDYDSTIRPNYKTVTNVTMKLIPKLAEVSSDAGTFILHNWLTLFWTDTHLTWTPSDYDGITFVHVKSYEIWVPDLSVYNSGDMSHDQNEMPLTECLLFHTGSITCVPSVKYISRCDVDYRFWPYDKHKCRITFGSWSHTGENVDFHLDGNGIDMDAFTKNVFWDLKFLKAVKQVKKYDCCPNDTFPMIDYTFLVTRHSSTNHMAQITPAIALVLLTLTVLWLDSRSVERVAVASVSFICHLLCIFNLHWQLPYNGANTPHILIFYRESLALSTFALILTVLLRKLQNMSIEMPKWISSTTTFVLNNRAGRFLILNEEESKIYGSLSSEENADVPKSGNESSWRYFAAIVEWLSFFCVVVTYVIILIILAPTG